MNQQRPQKVASSSTTPGTVINNLRARSPWVDRIAIGVGAALGVAGVMYINSKTQLNKIHAEMGRDELEQRPIRRAQDNARQAMWDQRDKAELDAYVKSLENQPTKDSATKK